MAEIPLRVVPDAIASPSRETVVRFPGVIVQLENGNQFRIAAGSVTFTLVATSFIAVAGPVQEFTDRVVELIQAGRNVADAVDAFGNVIRMGVLDPAVQR